MNDNNEQLIDNELQKETSVVSSLKNDSYISKHSKEDTNDHIYSNIFNCTNDIDKARTSNLFSNGVVASVKHIGDEDKKDMHIKDSQPLGLFGNNNNNIIHNKKIKVIVFQDESQNNIRILNRKKFAIVSNDLVTTFLIGNETFSQFSYPKSIEHDKRVNVYVLEKEKHKDEYICNDINEFISNLGIDNISNELSNNLKLFVQKVNDVFVNKNFINIKRCHLCWVLLCVFIILSLLAIAIVSTLSLVQTYNNTTQIIKLSNAMLIMLVCVMCVLMCLMIYYITSMPLLLKYKKLNYMWKMYKDNVTLVNKWNKSIFEVNQIKVSIPPSLDYIIFNKDPSQDIQIQNINLEHIKVKFNPSLTVEPIVFKDDKMEGVFHKDNV